MTVRSARPHRLAWLLLLLAAVAAPGCRDEGERIRGHLERAAAYEEDASFSEAILEYRSALQLDPNLVEAHYGLARLYLETHDLPRAHWELSETVRLAPDDLTARLELGQLSKLAGLWEECLAQTDAILAREPEHETAHILRAQALEGLGRLDEALAAYRRARELAPDRRAAILLLADFLRRRGDASGAERLYRELTEKHPSFSSYASLGAFLAADPERLLEAEQVYREGLGVAGAEEKGLAYRALAKLYTRAGRLEDAERVLREGVADRQDDLEMVYLLARFYRSQGRAGEADEVIEAAARAHPDEVQPQLVHSLSRAREGDLDGALAAAEAALAIDPEGVPARLRKAEVLADLGSREGERERIDEARRIVDGLLSEDGASAEALFVRAKVQLAEGDSEAAVTDLRRALELRSDWAQAHQVLGGLLFVRGDLPGARAELQRALELDAGLDEARRMLARVHAALGEDEAAIAEGRRLLREHPEDDALRLLVAQALVNRRGLDEGLAELERVPEERRDAEVLYAMGRVHRLQGRDRKARSEFEKARELRPHHPDLLRALLELDQREGRLAESAARIDEALARRPEDARLVHLSGLVLLLQGRGPEAERRLREAIDLDPNRLSFYETLARYFQATGRESEMVETYETALEASPDSAPVRLILGSLYELQGDPERAILSYERAIELDPDLAPAKNNLAYLLAETGRDLDRALDLAQQAKALLPDDPNAADTLGWVLYKKGIPSAALGYLREAARGYGTDRADFGVVRRHLALAYEANGESEKARETLEGALRDLEARRAGAADAPEPAWAAEVRAMLRRLGSEAAPSS